MSYKQYSVWGYITKKKEKRGKKKMIIVMTTFPVSEKCE